MVVSLKPDDRWAGPGTLLTAQVCAGTGSLPYQASGQSLVDGDPPCLPVSSESPCSCSVVFRSQDVLAFSWKRIKQELSQELADLQLFSQLFLLPPFLSLPLNQNGRKPKHRSYTSIQSNEIRAFCIYLVNPETLQVFNFSFPEPQDEHKDKTGRVERHRWEASFKILMKFNLIYN